MTGPFDLLDHEMRERLAPESPAIPDAMLAVLTDDHFAHPDWIHERGPRFLEGGHFRYAGKVGTGYDRETLDRLGDLLDRRCRRGPRATAVRRTTMQAGAHEAFGRTVQVTHPDRVVYPDVGLTKGELLEYHERIAPTMLPHVAGRRVAMKRYPDGIEEQGFFQKAAPEHLPEWVRRVDVPKREGGIVPHVVVEEEATLLELVQFGVVELHPWLSLADDLERPDRIVIDLDPEEGDLDGARLATRAAREALEDIGLDPRVMTSGSKGYHVVVAVEPTATYDLVRDLAHDVARLIAARHPEQTTVAHRIADRGGRVFVDWLRNGYGQTSVAPYGVRARPGAPVATPLDWDELGSADPRDYRVDNLFRRLGQRDDPWSSIGVGDPREARERLDGLMDDVS